MTMRIALVGGFPVEPARVQGGVDAALLYLVDGFRYHSLLDVSIFSPSTSLASDCVLDLNEYTVHQVLLPHFKAAWLAGFPSASRHFKYTLDCFQPDVVHGQGLALPGILATESGYPAVVTAHAYGLDQLRLEKSERFFSSLYAWLVYQRQQRPCVKQADHIVAPSAYIKGLLEADTSTPVSIIPEPTHDRFYRLKSTEQGFEKRLLYVGRISPRKRIHDLIRAVLRLRRRIPDIHLHIVGPVSHPSYYKQLQELVNKYGLDEHIRFLGHVHERDVLREYRQCAVVVHAAVHESFCLSVAQGMAARKPAIVSRSGNLPDLITDGESGFVVDVGDIDAWVERIETLLLDTELRRKMGERAHARAWDFHASRVARATYQVYERVLEEAN